MKNNIFTRIGVLVFSLITVLGLLFIIITYLSATYFFNASTELLNKDVAAHIAKFTSPFEEGNINRAKADSVFYNAMVVSPSIEVYFLDTTGKVIYYEAPDSTIKLWQIPLQSIQKLISSKGEEYTTSPDPKEPDHNKIFSAAEVVSGTKKLGYIYVILGSKEYNNISDLLFKSHAATLALEAFGIVIVVSFFLSFYYIKRLQKRYNKVVEVLEQYRQGNLAARFEQSSKDEFTPVTTSFNKMADLLSEKIAQVSKAEEERKNFIANISHDLRTPLSIASGYAETLITGQDEASNSAHQKEYIQLVLTKIKQVEKMVLQLFELSRMDSADFKPQKEPFIISEILQEIANSFGIAVAQKKIALSCIGCNEVVWTKGDIRMMERVIQNLLENALKNTPESGSITIQLARQEADFVASVENTGTPLDKGLVSWINDTSADDSFSTKTKHKRGLGLVIIKRILSLHHSCLQVETAAGGSNRFYFSLPIYKG